MTEHDQRSGRTDNYSLNKARQVLDRRELMRLGAAGFGAAVVAPAGGGGHAPPGVEPR